jgi:hypothetical protein
MIMAVAVAVVVNPVVIALTSVAVIGFVQELVNDLVPLTHHQV